MIDIRCEYRVRPALNGYWHAEYREPRIFWQRVGGIGRAFHRDWTEWKFIDHCSSLESAEAECRRHAGEGTKYLGRLP